MDGIHDLGGVEGFGPVPVKTGDASFSQIEEWEKRMWALARNGLASSITIDWFRHGIERMVPADYLSFAYFNKWCADCFMLMIDEGTITMEEVKRGHVGNPGPPATAITLNDALKLNSRANRSFEIEALTQPAFVVGETVRTHRNMPSGHTRLPRYARDAGGTVIAHHGCHLLPDEGARGRHVGDHLYTVSFTAAELWGLEANPRDTVALDLWECYLVRA